MYETNRKRKKKKTKKNEREREIETKTQNQTNSKESFLRSRQKEESNRYKIAEQNKQNTVR